jgi:YfiH family protein
VEINAVPEADASFATRSGVVCAIQTADCLPVLFCDTAGQVVANAHAGWRGLAEGVLENTVMRMREAGAGEIMAWLGPAIGAEKFEVGEDVFQAFTHQNAKAQQAFKTASSAHKYLADIYMLARMRLGNMGINRVYGGNYCTMTDVQNFYSYRRDKTTGRMVTVIWIK